MSLWIEQDGDEVPEEARHDLNVLVALFACQHNERPANPWVKKDIEAFLSSHGSNDEGDERDGDKKRAKRSTGGGSSRRKSGKEEPTRRQPSRMCKK